MQLISLCSTCSLNAKCTVYNFVLLFNFPLPQLRENDEIHLFVCLFFNVLSDVK